MAKKATIIYSLFLIGCSIFFARAQQFSQMGGGSNFYASNIDSSNWFALGQPKNNILVGIMKKPTQSEIFISLLYVSRTNSHQLWIAPPKFKRADYFLYDSSHRAVPFLASYNPPNKIFKNSSEAPKDFRNVHIGIMWPPFTMPYDQIALTNVFQIAHGGDYRLLVKGRIMKINDDGSLSLVIFPPASLMIHISDEDIGKKPN